MISVIITTIVVISNLAYDEVYSIQHYIIKCVNYLRQVGGFLRVLRFPLRANKTDRHVISEILLKVALNTINPNHSVQASHSYLVVSLFCFLQLVQVRSDCLFC